MMSVNEVHTPRCHERHNKGDHDQCHVFFSISKFLPVALLRVSPHSNFLSSALRREKTVVLPDVFVVRFVLAIFSMGFKRLRYS